MVVEVESLNKFFRKGFRKIHTLKNVSFKVQEKQILAILGSEGSGKTTLLKILTGIISGESFYGFVRMFGKEDIRTVRDQIGFLPKNPEFFKNISAEELLEFSQKISGIEFNEKGIDSILKEVHLIDHKKEKIKGFSRGMIQRIGIAQAIIHNPRILIIDEPLSDLDPAERVLVIDIIKKFFTERKVVIFSTQSVEDVDVLGTDVIVLKEGEIVFEENLSELRGRGGYRIVVEHKGKKKVLKARNSMKLWEIMDDLKQNEIRLINIKSEISEILKKYYD